MGFLFDMMMTVMMHYNGDEDNSFLCHRQWDFDNLLHLALKDALLRDHLWPLHNFLLLMWDVKVHIHLLLDMVMTMVDDDGCSRPQEQAQSLFVSSELALQLYASPVDG